MSNVGGFFKELRQYSWLMLLVGSCFGSYVAWSVDTARIKITQEAHAATLAIQTAQLAEDSQKLESLDKATAIIQNDIPKIKADVSELKADVKTLLYRRDY